MTPSNYEQCAGCPLVGENIENIRQLEQYSRHIGECAMLPSVDKVFAPALLQELQGDPRLAEVLDEEQLNSPADIAERVRTDTAKLIDRADTEIQEIEEENQYIADGCKGPLKMRAARNGEQVTATVCMSPQASRKQAIEPAKIHRKTL